VLLVVGENDFLIPSAEEAPRLQRTLPRCRSVLLAGRSHAILQEAGFDLVMLLKAEGFYAPSRTLSSDAAQHQASSGVASMAAAAASSMGSAAVGASKDPAAASSAGAVQGLGLLRNGNSKGMAGARRSAAELASATVGQAGSTGGSGRPLAVAFGSRGPSGPKQGVAAAASSASSSTIDAAPRGSSTASESRGSGNGGGDGGNGGGSPPPAQHQRARKRVGASTGVNFGKAAPLQLPTATEVKKATEGGIDLLKRVVSPVYFSTDSSGRVQQGLGAIPTNRPLLFVGNHQLFAPDMPLMVEQFLQEREMLLRGLAHPIIFGMGSQPSSSDSNGSSSGGGSRGDGQAFSSFLQTFGAVPVSGRNLHALLSQGEAALLYPGGVREVSCGWWCWWCMPCGCAVYMRHALPGTTMHRAACFPSK
jgi:hypothetical protein